MPPKPSKRFLSTHNTFGIEVEAQRFISVSSPDQLTAIIDRYPGAKMVLGGGSNILFTQDPEPLILYNRILGKELVSQTEEEVIVRIGGGEIWHDFVLWCLAHDWGGVENLSLIPGTV